MGKEINAAPVSVNVAKCLMHELAGQSFLSKSCWNGCAHARKSNVRLFIVHFLFRYQVLSKYRHYSWSPLAAPDSLCAPFVQVLLEFHRNPWFLFRVTWGKKFGIKTGFVVRPTNKNRFIKLL
jgi:hypothetical protein